MAKKSKVVKVDTPEEVKTEVKIAPSTGLKTAKVDHDELMKLQDDGKLVGWDPKTGIATYKEE